MLSDKKWRFGRGILSILLMLTVFSIGDLASARQPDGTDERAYPTRKSTDLGGLYNFYARFLAGMPVQAGPLADLQNRPGWEEYSRYFDQNWKNLNNKLLIPERKWAERELGDLSFSKSNVLYPFSGPDFANVNAFFPEARTYVLVALEQLGEIPKFSDMNDGEFKSYFQSMKTSLRDLLNLNYFISAHMDAEIEGSEIKGVLPVLLFMLARDNAKVVDVRYWTMGPEGRIREFPAIGTTARDFPALGTIKLDLYNIQGIRITFNAEDSDGNRPQTIYYFRLDLSNGSFDKNRNFISFLKSLGPYTTFMKSASYVMFDNKVSTARQFVLDQSRYIVQEDSGIPLKYFQSSLWDFQFYGRYLKPISTFSQNYQEELASIYKSDKKIKPLPFGFGYYFNPAESNLMFGEKKPMTRGRDETPYDNSDSRHFLYNDAVILREHSGS